MIPVLCQHSERGCHVEANRETIKTHEDSCEFRLVRCVGCTLAFPANKLVEHINEAHNFRQVEGYSFEVSRQSGTRHYTGWNESAYTLFNLYLALTNMALL